MQDTTDISTRQDQRPHTALSGDRAGKSRKAYTAPQIEDFGRIADLTLSLNNVSPGDYGGGSFAT